MYFDAARYLLALLWLASWSAAQNAQCVILANGCSAGQAHSAGLNRALSRFQDGSFYGGGQQPIISSALGDDDLCMITYSCPNGTTLPRLEGSVIRSTVQKVLGCANQCGGIALAGGSGCGFGVLVADDAANDRCYVNAIDVEPDTADTAIKSSVDMYRNPACFVDTGHSAVLNPGGGSGTGGSGTDAAAMTVEKCVGLASPDGWRYAGLKSRGECFFADVLADGASSTTLNQCNTPCPGDQAEVCGADNRILIYTNANWNVKSRLEIAGLLQAYVNLMQQFLDALHTWQTALRAYQNALSAASATKKVKRQDTGVDPAVQQTFRDQAARERAVKTIAKEMEARFGPGTLDLIIKLAVRMQKVRSAEATRYIETVAKPAAKVVTDVSAPAISIPEAGAAAETVVEVVTEAATTVGTAAAVGTAGEIIAATGLFAALDFLIDIFRDIKTDPGNDNPPKPSITTPASSTPSRTSSSSSSSSSTSTTPCSEIRGSETYPADPELKRRQGHVEKRDMKLINFCGGGKEYHAGIYDSAGVASNYNPTPLLFGYVNPDICWDMQFGRLPISDFRSGKFATEHILEAQMLGIFIDKINEENGVIFPHPDPTSNVQVDFCFLIQTYWYDLPDNLWLPDNNPTDSGEFFLPEYPISEVGRSWPDKRRYRDEFVILESQVNGRKEAIWGRGAITDLARIPVILANEPEKLAKNIKDVMSVLKYHTDPFVRATMRIEVDRAGRYLQTYDEIYLPTLTNIPGPNGVPLHEWDSLNMQDDWLVWMRDRATAARDKANDYINTNLPLLEVTWNTVQNQQLAANNPNSVLARLLRTIRALRAEWNAIGPTFLAPWSPLDP